MTLVIEALEALGVKCKLKEGAVDDATLRLRVGGFDRRKVMFKGWVELENFRYTGTEGSFCIMQRDDVRLLGNVLLEMLTHWIYRVTRFHGDNCGRH